mmetsp:Transcript_39205/g.112748  ORF Transcript_39205/g.112748 Transcript_39205/m.112748 type:complete len:271 (-) Transcript_39205:497-1309(-)
MAGGAMGNETAEGQRCAELACVVAPQPRGDGLRRDHGPEIVEPRGASRAEEPALPTCCLGNRGQDRPPDNVEDTRGPHDECDADPLGIHAVEDASKRGVEGDHPEAALQEARRARVVAEVVEICTSRHDATCVQETLPHRRRLLLELAEEVQQDGLLTNLPCNSGRVRLPHLMQVHRATMEIFAAILHEVMRAKKFHALGGALEPLLPPCGQLLVHSELRSPIQRIGDQRGGEVDAHVPRTEEPEQRRGVPCVRLLRTCRVLVQVGDLRA